LNKWAPTTGVGAKQKTPSTGPGANNIEIPGRKASKHTPGTSSRAGLNKKTPKRGF